MSPSRLACAVFGRFSGLFSAGADRSAVASTWGLAGRHPLQGRDRLVVGRPKKVALVACRPSSTPGSEPENPGTIPFAPLDLSVGCLFGRVCTRVAGSGSRRRARALRHAPAVYNLVKRMVIARVGGENVHHCCPWRTVKPRMSCCIPDYMDLSALRAVVPDRMPAWHRHVGARNR